MSPEFHYLILGCILFSIGVLGVLIRRNVIIVLMCVELMLNAVNLILVSVCEPIFVFFIMMVAAVEVSVGLALIARIYRKFGTTDISTFGQLKG
jgi:NADH-quinone oxidoreductase subunit K